MAFGRDSVTVPSTSMTSSFTFFTRSRAGGGSAFFFFAKQAKLGRAETTFVELMG
eukprot:CAMPEP_0197553372 /NCGR_PEP_ID=MMETSP1320-20131121/8756_1 /TAXON_ID=91990 /ORGANISM="Bolidomonas sp., Strain RCC2347" /LENGTH=54 /DNA_ID=CAMNT_0043114117 /DNA_START=234 /DNA_END=398 /DNA_ORIENTATION=+